MDYGHDPAPAPPSRRERNKQATRRAISTAALDLMREQGYEALTVDLVAEQAGVSRRTFFNYFPSINDALHDHVAWIFEHTEVRLAERAEQLPIMEAVMATLQDILSVDLLDKVAYLAVQGERIPSLQAAELATWARSMRHITPELIKTHPDKDPFVITVFAQALLGALSAAFQTWAVQATLPINPQDIDELGKRLTSAMELVRDGFPHLHEAARKA